MKIPEFRKRPPLNMVVGDSLPPIVLCKAKNGWLDEEYNRKLSLDVIHDGWQVPERFMQQVEDREALDRAFAVERDWGAHLVADSIAARLGLCGYYLFSTARALVDYGRLPRSVDWEPDEGTVTEKYANRGAIPSPFRECLDESMKEKALTEIYDSSSRCMESIIDGRLLKIAIHTYDRRNVTGTVRPPVSLITRSTSYQRASAMPEGVFDNLYPDILGEFTADRVLTYRLGLRLEAAGIPAALDLPYTYPPGSVEVRSQVWHFFRKLEREFKKTHRSDRSVGPTLKEASSMVWRMLQNTNSRNTDTLMLRDFIAGKAEPPTERRRLFDLALEEYYVVSDFLQENYDKLVNQGFRYWHDRPSSLAIEIRKDFLWPAVGELNDRPPTMRDLSVDNLNRVVRAISLGLMEYINYDHPRKRVMWTSRTGWGGIIDM